jgi:hypothetical protein
MVEHLGPPTHLLGATARRRDRTVTGHALHHAGAARQGLVGQRIRAVGDGEPRRCGCGLVADEGRATRDAGGPIPHAVADLSEEFIRGRTASTWNSVLL